MSRVTDVYDCLQWKKTMGPHASHLDPRISRIKLLFCTDGFPVFNYKVFEWGWWRQERLDQSIECVHHAYQGAESMQPGMNIVLSLPPWERYKAKNILISMLIPSKLSASSQKKFFDKIVDVDYNPMIKHGLKSPRGETVQVQIFAQVRPIY